MKTEIQEDTRLQGATVFLSASYPEWSPESTRELDSRDVLDAVSSITRAILGAGGRILYGGHPTISPIILDVASEYAENQEPIQPIVIVYQSLYFDEHPGYEIPRATRRLGKKEWAELRWSDSVNDSESESLRLMRQEMIHTLEPDAAIFIGGKDGIIEEWRMYKEEYPERPAIPIGSAGGDAELILQSPDRFSESPSDRRGEFDLEEAAPNLIQDLLESQSYPRLAIDIVDVIEEHVRR